jgi:hypothetical protein
LYCSIVRRRSWLFWAFLLVLVTGAVVYGPAELAQHSTAADEPVSFLSHPLEGWKFMLTAARERPDAVAGTPAEARQIALRTFDDGTLRPTRVDLLWLPDRRVQLRTLQGNRMLTTNSQLLWKVTGHRGQNGPNVTVGLIDLATGRVIYDGRLAAE